MVLVGFGLFLFGLGASGYLDYSAMVCKSLV